MHVLFNRLLSSKKSRDEKKRLSTSTTSSSSSSSMKKKYWIKKKQNRTASVDHEQHQKQQDLLTQCISNALFVDVNPSQVEPGIRFQEHAQEEEEKKPRTRKLSLPPQPAHMGYLASIPEAEDSQVTLYKN